MSLRTPAFRLTPVQIFSGIAALTLLPTASHLITTRLGHFGFGIPLRLLIHLLLPVVFTAYVRRISLRQAFILPLVSSPGRGKWTWGLGIAGALAAVLSITAAYVAFGSMLDTAAIVHSLAENFGITAATYPLVAVALTLGNPF